MIDQTLKRDPQALEDALLQAGARQDGNSWFCPAHNDRNTPNGKISEHNGTWRYKCWSCGFEGDVFDVQALAQDKQLKDILPITYNGNGHASNGNKQFADAVEDLATRRGWRVDVMRAAGAVAEKYIVKIPMRNEKGERTGDRLRRGDGKMFIIHGVEKKAITNPGGKLGLMYPSPLPEGKVLVVEGEADLFSVLSAGWTGAAIALPGISPGTKVFKYLQGLVAGREVVIMPDPGAGVEWVQKIGGFLQNAGCQVSYVPALDVDTDKRLKRGETLDELLASALPLQDKIVQDDCEPLEVARCIGAKHPEMVFVGGDFFDFGGKVFDDIPVELIDREAIPLIGGGVRKHFLSDVRHLLGVLKFQTDDYFSPMGNHYIALQNGVFDVEAETLRKHSPEYRTRNLLPVSYEPSADCPRFKQALGEWLPDDNAARELLIEWLGLCLISDTSFHKALFLISPGGGGTTTFASIPQLLLGARNVTNLPLASLNAARTFPTAGLHNKLVNVSPESELGRDLDEGWLKSLISGDPVTVERKNRDPFVMTPTARFIICSNNPFHLNDKSEGIWRRLLVVRFPNAIPESMQDHDLMKKLADERSGIFNLAISGLFALKRRGRFLPSAEMEAEKASYRRDCNPLAVWRDECLPDAPGLTPLGEPWRVSAQDAYSEYSGWCRDSGHSAYSRHKFTKELKRLGVADAIWKQFGATIRGFEGVKLERSRS